MVPFPSVRGSKDEYGAVRADAKIRENPDGKGLILPRIKEEFHPYKNPNEKERRAWANLTSGIVGDGARGLEEKHAAVFGLAGAIIGNALYFMGMHPDDAYAVYKGALDDTTRKQPVEKIYDPKFHEEALDHAMIRIIDERRHYLGPRATVSLEERAIGAKMLHEAAGIIPAAIEAGKAFGEVVERLKKNGTYPDAKSVYQVFERLVDDPLKFRKIKYYAGDAGKEFLKKLHAAHIIAYELAPDVYKERSAVEPYLTEEEKKEAEKMAEEWKRFARGHLEKNWKDWLQ